MEYTLVSPPDGFLIAFNLDLLHDIAKAELYSALYGSLLPLFERADEESCGAVIAAARFCKETENED